MYYNRTMFDQVSCGTNRAAEGLFLEIIAQHCKISHRSHLLHQLHSPEGSTSERYKGHRIYE